MSIRKYGWCPDIPDHRDLLYAAPHVVVQSIDLRPACPPIFDQLSMSACTGNAIAFAIEFDLMQQGLNPLPLSRMFIYCNERIKEQSLQSDAGAAIRDGIKSVAIQGICPDRFWTYTQLNLHAVPSSPAYVEARKTRAKEYQRVPRTLEGIYYALANKSLVIFGIAVYESFESCRTETTGVVHTPTRNEQQLGGHCMAIVGIDLAARRFIVSNSWGGHWGLKGYCYIPFDYMLSDLADDFWLVRSISL